MDFNLIMCNYTTDNDTKNWRDITDSNSPLTNENLVTKYNFKNRQTDLAEFQSDKP